ncbi:MAG: glycosyltransferase family 39 protein [Proteobacteria bacterium]|nr:glycosyltransferase family 39 protein [Pseudomonadota bacterium]
MTKLFADWRFYWFLILLPVALLLPALPIDETRYLTVAWEMRASGDWLHLQLNGAPYADKGPLLFWLVNLAWFLGGMHVWIVRLGVLAASLASLIVFERLVLRISADAALARRAAILLSGVMFFAVFASAIMFDVVLMLFVLMALHGLVDFDERRWRRGIGMLSLGLGLGLLTKGPVVLLDVVFVALLAPWWSATARMQKARWYTVFLVGIFGGLLVALIWAVASFGVLGFWKAIVLKQTAGRIANSFAHARPFWWYFMVLPVMVVPWTLSLRAPWRVWRASFTADKAVRFGLVGFAPAFVVFCFFSGKQPHYLLPLLPSLAICVAYALGDDAARVRGRAFGALLLVVGALLLAAPWLTARVGGFSPTEQQVIAGIWPVWGALIALMGTFLLAHPRAHAQLPVLALASATAASLGMLTLAQAVGPTVDVSAVALRIRAAQEAGKPIVHIGNHHGLFGFPGRLTQPFEKVELADLYTWCAAHPEGEVITIYSKYGVPVKPELEVPWRTGRILIWRAADLCRGPHLDLHAKPDADDTPDT